MHNMLELTISLLTVAVVAYIHPTEGLSDQLNTSSILNITGPKGSDVTRDLLHNSLLKKLHTIATSSSSGLATKGFLGIDSVMEVIGPLALAAMVTLPFMAPAAAALLPLAGLTSVFGRRRRHLGDQRENVPESSRQQEWNINRRRKDLSHYPFTGSSRSNTYALERIKTQRNIEALLKVFHDALRDTENFPK